MFIFNLWKNRSIREKIWGLVLLPVLVIFGLTAHQVLSVNNQLKSLNKATHLINAIDLLKELNKASYKARKLYNVSNALDALAKVELETSVIFSKAEKNKLELLVTEYQEALEAISNFEDAESHNDNVQWQADIHNQLLLTLEKTQFKASIPTVTNHLKALFQLEWLMLWVQEENWQSQQLFNGINSNDDTSQKRDKIRSLVQNQQLFVDRFVAMNADTAQVSLLLSAFTNIAFENSNIYREKILDVTQLKQLTPQEITLGNEALLNRLILFKSVADSISHKLKQNIIKNITLIKKQRILFLVITAFSVIIILILGIALAHRITNNLKVILKYLENKNSENYSLAEHLTGRDEINQFAIKVERLNIERQRNQKELLLTKNEAIKSKEQAIEANKAKSSFLANMSHEIRTPLNGVIGVSEILAGTTLNTTQKDYVDTIETSSNLLLSLINDILDFSKIESGKLSISKHPTCLRDCVYDIASIVSPKLKEKNITLKINIDSNLPAKMMADDHRIRQILMNLMSNAVKFTDSGAVTIGVQYNINNQSCLFEVSDTGIGVTEKKQMQIFEPFLQADNSITRQFGGTGLGLAISTQLTELMGGELQIKSVINEGSCFYFSLPLEAVKNDTTHHIKLNSSPNIILVCNNLKTTNTLLEELVHYGVDVEKVSLSLSNVKPALNELQQIVIYAPDNAFYDSIDLELLTPFNQHKNALCIIQPFNAPKLDFGTKASSVVTFPLLGKLLTKALERCDDFLQSPTQHISSDVKSLNSSNTLTSPSVLNNINTQYITSNKLLLVDDNKINLKVASLHLTKLGYKYDIANNGQEAVDLFAAYDYPLILMDCMMPVKDGFTATKEIKQYAAKHKKIDTTIIAMTAHIDEDVIKKFSEYGFDDHLEKPFKAEDLKLKLQKALNNTVLIKNNDIEESDSIESDSVEKNHSPLRVLLVEDNKINQKVAIIILKKAGYQYVVANNGQEGINIFKEDCNFNIILMDLMMPIKDGFEASKEIRAFEKENNLSETPIIAVTASVVNDDITQCFYAGMNAYIPKPIRPEKLYNEIDNLISAASKLSNTEKS